VLPQGWTELVALLDGRPDADPMSRLKRLCGLGARVTETSGAAVSISSHDDRSTVCATDDVSDRLEELQDTIGEGPRVDVSANGHSVLVADLAQADEQWPGFTPAASLLGVEAMFVLPLRMGALQLGTLTVHRTEPGALSPDQLKDARILVEAASVLLTLDQPGEESASAFAWVLGDDSRFRPEVHQAVGATMVHLDAGPREAFARICAHAYATDTSVADVAREILANRLRLEPD
jgi:GAF domain-containing protein